MSFLKTKKFWIPFSVIGIGVVAIGTGVGLHQKHQNAINIYEGNSRGEIRTKLRNALETISPEDIRVNLNASGINRKSLTQTIGDSGLYAFNVEANQLDLSSNVSIPSGIQIGFELDKEKNTLEILNDGVLNIKLIATTPFSDEKQTRDLTLNTFKKADEKLNGLVNQNSTNSVLEIAQPEELKDTYTTIEQLNSFITSTQATSNDQISGLSNLLRKSFNKTNEQSNSRLSIEGEVKLDRFELKDQKVYFYLTSANNSFLKLTNKQNEITTETLVKEVKLSNIAPSEVIVVPNGFGYGSSYEFKEELKKSLGENNKSKTDEIVIQTPSSTTQPETNPVHVNIKPYLVVNAKDSVTLTTSIQVVFGKGGNKKIYDTNRFNDVNALKNVGFKFNVYSKKLNKTDKALTITDIDGMNNMKKLDRFFKAENFKKPVEKPMHNDGPMFTTQALTLADNTRGNVVVNTNGNTGNGNMQNWLLVADYSYTGVDSGTKVLLTPTLSVVHLEKTLIYTNGVSTRK